MGILFDGCIKIKNKENLDGIRLCEKSIIPPEILEKMELVSSEDNIDGNYINYTESVLKDISLLKDVDFEQLIKGNEIILDYLDKDKKILLLDLDETLVHSEIIYKMEKEFDLKLHITLDNMTISLGVNLRPGLLKFLETLSKYFILGIFTASANEYSDKIIEIIDKEHKLIKFKINKDYCIKINEFIYIKDLRIIQGIDLKKVILLDNSIYSFANQLSNGVLINSFYDDKNDIELENISSYLIEQIYPANDVREINDKIFKFNEVFCKYL